MMPPNPSKTISCQTQDHLMSTTTTKTHLSALSYLVTK